MVFRFCAKTAHRLAHTSAVVVLEDLKTRSMTRRAKPVEDPDNAGQFLANGAASKSGLKPGHPGKRVASVRGVVEVCVPLHRDPGDQSPGRVHLVTVFGVWACGPEIA
jgi:hypothetical protein